MPTKRGRRAAEGGGRRGGRHRRPGADYLDVEVIDEPAGALPVGQSAAEELDEGQNDELTLNFEEPERERRHRDL